MNEFDKLLDELLWQINGYNKVFRKTTQPLRRAMLAESFKGYEPEFDDNNIQETLMEHVGSLPIIATYLHPFLEHQVDLGKVLTMIAIHDIGELETGDIITSEK